jgi:hypothetical protein
MMDETIVGFVSLKLMVAVLVNSAWSTQLEFGTGGRHRRTT